MHNSYYSGNCGCHDHGHYPHNHLHGIYGTNMWNVNGNQPGNQYLCGHQQACNGCIDVIKALCVLYGGPNLVGTGINQNDDLNTVIAKLDAIKVTQDTKNTNILAALNDINARLNVLEVATHAPYVLI